MTQSFITAHYGEEHVSAYEASLVQSLLYGSGRYRLDGLNLTVPNPNLLHVSNGIALIDGRWYLITGGGENLDIPPGSIGMQRKDRVFLVYYRNTEGVEELKLEYVAGTPTTGTAVAPTNQHPTNLSSQPTHSWIPFCEIPISGYTVGRPTMLLTTRTLTLPAQQCKECASLMAEAESTLAECRMATARAEEVIRSVPAALEEYDQRIKNIETLVNYKIELMQHQIRQLAAMLANNIAAYVLVGDTLAVPSAWIDYDKDKQSVLLEYTSYDEKQGKFTIDQPITIDERVETNTAFVDYLMMMSGEE